MLATRIKGIKIGQLFVSDYSKLFVDVSFKCVAFNFELLDISKKLSCSLHDLSGH